MKDNDRNQLERVGWSDWLGMKIMDLVHLPWKLISIIYNIVKLEKLFKFINSVFLTKHDSIILKLFLAIKLNDAAEVLITVFDI